MLCCVALQRHADIAHLTATVRLQDEGPRFALLRAFEVLPQRLKIFWQDVCLGAELVVSRKQGCHGCDAACKRLFATQLQHAGKVIDFLHICTGRLSPEL